MIFHLPSLMKVFGRLMLDRRVPWYAKLIPCISIIYILSPIDLIPGLLLPVIGGLDDIFAFFLGIKGLVALTPQSVIEEHLARVEQGL